jgi:hypothetical protein
MKRAAKAAAARPRMSYGGGAMSELSHQSAREPMMRTLQRDTLGEVERALALAEMLRAELDALTAGVAGLSTEDDDPMHRAAECVGFAWRQAEDVVGGLSRASARIRDDMRVPRRGAELNG